VSRVRLAWFSPFPPARSGVASYSAAVVPLLAHHFDIDCYPESNAHDFVWRHRRAPYDLTVYQIGNSAFHDYMWAYASAYPGLIVLHDARLHHARARQLLRANRFDDYRREFWFDHPDAPRDFVEYAIEGLSGAVYYLWPMIRSLMRTARLIAVHNQRVAKALQGSFPEAAVEYVPLGRAPLQVGATQRREARLAMGASDTSVVFAVFGQLTAEKRIGAILRAFASIVHEGVESRLLLVGNPSGYPSLDAELTNLSIVGHVSVSGYADAKAFDAYLAAADVCLCLRWPTALETSGVWLDCLAAGKATVISDLAHMVDVPSIDLRQRAGPTAASLEGPSPVAVRIDLLDEDRALRESMRRLASDAGLRDRLARAGEAHWAANYTVELSAAGYRRVIAAALERPAPACHDLPRHFRNEYADLARGIADRFGVMDRIPLLR
jgi:glycosyltransferase involved in cell wall biosynthesis